MVQSLSFYKTVLQTLTFTSTGEYETSPASKNAIFLFYNEESFVSTFKSKTGSFHTQFLVAFERAYKGQTQRYQDNFKGTFAANKSILKRN